MADYDRSAFAGAVLDKVGAPHTAQNMDFMLSWMAREGTQAAYNPLATTLNYGGGTGFNSVGVKNYADFDTGVGATAQTLLHSGYNDIVEGLRSGGGAWGASAGLSRWSGGDYSSLKGGAANASIGAAAAAGATMGAAVATEPLGNRLNQIKDIVSGNPAQPDTASPATAATAGAATGVATGVAAKAIDAAKTALGQPYVWGGTDLGSGVDCSGLIQSAYKAAGITLPRVSNDQARAGTPVSFEDAQPGDILWWDFSSDLPGADHVALYLGNGQMIEALHRGSPVHIVAVRKPDGVTRVTGSSNIKSTSQQVEVGPNDSLPARLAAISAALTSQQAIPKVGAY